METPTAIATNLELFEHTDQLNRDMTRLHGQFLEVIGEVERRQAFRDEGATSTAAWLAERLGLSAENARNWVQLALQLDDHPLVATAICEGELTVDKARATLQLAALSESIPISDDATAQDDALESEEDGRIEHPDKALLEQARHCTVHQLTEMTRAARGASSREEATRFEGRYLRCNDTRRTVNMQLPDDEYVFVRNVLDQAVSAVPSDGETPYDQRMCDAMLQILHAWANSGTAERGDETLVVVHADLALLRGGTGRAELERLGLLSREAAQRIACDANVALAIDDAFGHTMAEGRKRRFPSAAQRREVRRRDRHCRFPGCSNSVYTNVHHIVHWADGGKTDLINLVTLCNYHHHRVHEERWQMSGNPNGTLQFMGPTKRLMASRPSPLWTMRN